MAFAASGRSSSSVRTGRIPTRLMLPSISSHVLPKNPSALSVGTGLGGGPFFFWVAASAPELKPSRTTPMRMTIALFRFRTEFLDVDLDNWRVHGARCALEVRLEGFDRRGGVARIALQEG